MTDFIRALRRTIVGALIMGVFVVVALVTPQAQAATGINQQVNFQGRLLTAQGATVPDGYYNIQFKIYQDGTGTVAGNPSGTLKWTESWLNNDGHGVQVKNGYMSVQLGSLTSLSSIDWNQDTLWLSINVGNTNATCTPFTSCSGDGEMLPMKRLSSTPYALNSGLLGGLTSAQFLQLAQGVQTEAGTNTTSVAINKTGAGGNFLDLQSSSVDVFKITNTGDITFGSSIDHAISVGTAAASTAGKALTISAGTAGTGATALTGGTLTLQGGTGGGTGGNGGNLVLDAGAAASGGTGGTISIGSTNASAVNIGQNTTIASGKSLTLTGGAARPTGVEGMLWYDTTTKQLLTYSNGKWQADRTTSTKIVAASNSTQTEKDAADYVATGTGDQTVINSALTAAAGGKVYLMEGTYTVNGSISVPNNTTLAGAGAGTVITIPDSFNANINAIVNADTSTGTGVTIQDLQLDGNKANQTAGTMYGIYFNHMGSSSGATAVKGGKITNVWLKSWYFGGGAMLDSSNNNVITGNTMVINGRIDLTLSASSYNTVSGNLMQGNGNAGIQLASNANYNTVTGNTVSGHVSWGIDMSSSYNTISGNNITGNSNGIGCGSYNLITGNTFSRALAVLTTGITCNNSHHTTIANNTLQQNTVYGIQLLASHDMIVENNVINDNGNTTDNNAIYLNSSSKNNAITGNTITDTSATTTNYAINITDSGSSSNYLANNNFSSTPGTSTINDLGTGTVYANQPRAENGAKLTNRTANDAESFTVQNAAGTNVLAVDTTNSKVLVAGALDTTTSTTLSIGTANASAITIGSSGVTTGVAGLLNANGGLTVASSQTLTNNGATINGVLALGNFATGGSIGNANATVDIATGFTINQTTAGQTLLLPNPTSSTTGRTIYVSNIGNQTFTMGGFTIAANGTAQFVWNGASWTLNGNVGGSGNFIQNQNSTAQTASFYINGTGTAATLQGSTSVLTPLLDAATTSTALNIGTTNANAINLNQNVTIATGKSLTLTGGASRPTGVEGMLWYDTTTKQLLIYSNGKWQADRSTSTKIVAASNASQALKDGADYIATGTSDQTVINNALTAAAGGKVYLTEGTYTINGSISVPNNTTLAGAGTGTVITIPNALNSTSFYAITNTTTGGSGTGITIQDLTVDGNKANQTSGNMRGIYFNGVGSGSGSSAVQGGKITNVWANNWYGSGTGHGIYLTSSYNNILTGNTAKGNGSAGIDIESSPYNTITSNLTQGNGGAGIALTTTSSNNTVTGNTSQGNANYGIQLSSSSNNNVTGNTAQGNTLYGILMSVSSSTNTISGNRIYDNGGAATNNGIYLDASANTNNTITGNSITDSSATTNYAINIQAGSTSTYLADNTLGTGTVNDAGTGTIYASQYSNGTNFLIQPATNITMGSSTTTTTVQGSLAITPQTSTSTTLLCSGVSGVVSSCDSSVLAPTATNFIKNSATLQSSSNFYISGTGKTDTAFITPAIRAASDTTGISFQNAAGSSTVMTVDTTNSRVGIGTTSASSVLHVASNDTSSASPILTVEQKGTGNATLNMKSTTESWYTGVDSSDGGTFKINSASAANTTTNFGNTSAGTSSDTNDNNVLEAARFTTTAAGTVSSLLVNSTCTISAAPNNQFRMALYADNGSGTAPGTMLSQSGASTIVTGWNQASIAPVSVTNGTYYWIVYNTNGTASNNNCFRTTTSSGGVNVWSSSYSFAAMPSSWPSSAGSSTDNPSFYGKIQTSVTTNNYLNSLFQITNTGRTTLHNNLDSTSAFQVQNAASTSVMTVDTTNSKVLIAGALDTTTAMTLSIGTTTATAITIGKTGVTTTVQGPLTITPQTSTSTTLLCTNSGVVSTCDTSVLAPTATNFIKNGVSQQASSNFNISGTGVAATLQGSTSVLTPLLDAATASTALNIGTTNASTINLNQNVTVASGKSLTLAGGITTNRPTGVEGMLWYDTTTKQLLTYSNNKWQSDRSTSTKIVAASNASQALKDGADYVATGTSDQTIINNALTAAAGGKVYLTEGTYTVNGSINVPNNTVLSGAGNGTIITIPSSLNTSINVITNTDTSTGTGMTIRDLKLNGNSSGNTAGNQTGLYLYNVGANGTGATITGLQVLNFRSDAVYLLNVGASTVNGNLFNAATTANGSAAVDAKWTQGVTFSNNTFTSNYWGLRLDGSSSDTVTGNYFYSNNEGLNTNSASNNTITGNTFNANATDVDIYQSTNTVVSSNSSTSNSYRGINLDTSSNNTITDNNIQNSGGPTTNNAIIVTGDANSNTITGNTITDASASSNNYAITIATATADTNYLANNTLGTGTVNDSGTGTIYAGQYKTSTSFLIQPTTNMTIGGSATTTTIQGSLAITPQTSTSTTLLCSGVSGVVSTCDTSVLAPTATNFIQNQSATAQAANFYINGTGKATTLQASTSVLSGLFDAVSAGALNIGTGTATSITLGKSGVATTTAGGLLTSTVDTASAGTLTVGASTATGITLGKTGVATTTAGGLLTNSIDATSATALTIGGTTASSVNVGKSTGSVNLLANTTLIGTSGSTITVQGAAQVTSNSNGNYLTVQGSTGNGNGSGGRLTLQGGTAGATTGNGGDVYLTGGTATGTGATGLVVINTPTYQTATADSACYTGGNNVGSSCTISSASVNSNGAIIVGFSTVGLTATLPDPSNTLSSATGRVIYITASTTSSDFTLSVNGGGQGNQIAMRKNTTATMIWNGADWTAAGASSSTTLQAAYDNTLQSAGGAELVVSKTSATNGLTIRDSTTNSVNGALLTVQSSSAANLFSVNSNVTEYATDAGAEVGGAGGGTSDNTFPANTWATIASPASTVTRYTTAGDNIATGQGSVSVTTPATANAGVMNKLSTALTANMTYNVSFSTRLPAGSSAFTDMSVYYSMDGTTTSPIICVSTPALQTSRTSIWTKVNCTFQAPSTGVTANNAILIRQATGVARTFYLDNLSVTIAANYNYAADPGVDDTGMTNWTVAGTATVAQNPSDGNDASSSAQITTSTANSGIRNKLSINPLLSTLYRVSVYTKLNSGTALNDFTIRYTPNAGSNFISCVDYSTQIVTSSWAQITCYIKTDTTALTTPYVYFTQATASGTRVFSIDTFSMTLASNSTPNVQIGSGSNGGPTTLFTLDKGASAPIAANNDSLLGSMYYDTTLGKLQCYEADGWGACGSSPDNIITISPEYTNAVMHGTGIGTMTSDFCSDTLGINNSTNPPAVCGTNETYNFYRWTSPQASEQAYSIYVTYQLPTTFKSFASGQTSLQARVSSLSTAYVKLQIYKNHGGLSPCGTNVTITTAANSWQSPAAFGTADPSTCGFAAGDSIVFKITMGAWSNANAYIGNLNFTFSNK